MFLLYTIQRESLHQFEFHLLLTVTHTSAFSGGGVEKVTCKLLTYGCVVPHCPEKVISPG